MNEQIPDWRKREIVRQAEERVNNGHSYKFYLSQQFPNLIQNKRKEVTYSDARRVIHLDTE